MSKREDYAELATEWVGRFAKDQIAFTTSELEAKLADSVWPGAPHRLEPHHLSTARRVLGSLGVLHSASERSWGGHTVEMNYWTDSTAAELIAAASAKRSATVAYLSWAIGNKRHPNGLVGPAAEHVVNEAMIRAAPVAGYRLLPRNKKGVEAFGGRPITGGPLDNAATFIVEKDGQLIGVGLMPVEVKNRRDWIYPNSHELYQLLYKAAELQLENDTVRICPVLICRRAHYTTHRMAKALGFHVVQTRLNYLAPSADVDPDDVGRVRNVLGFQDLIQTDQPDPALVRQFTEHIPKVAYRATERWVATAAVLRDEFKALRNPSLDGSQRAEFLNELRELARANEIDHTDGGW